MARRKSHGSLVSQYIDNFLANSRSLHSRYGNYYTLSFPTCELLVGWMDRKPQIQAVRFPNGHSIRWENVKNSQRFDLDYTTIKYLEYHPEGFLFEIESKKYIFAYLAPSPQINKISSVVHTLFMYEVPWSCATLAEAWDWFHTQCGFDYKIHSLCEQTSFLRPLPDDYDPKVLEPHEQDEFNEIQAWLTRNDMPNPLQYGEKLPKSRYDFLAFNSYKNSELRASMKTWVKMWEKYVHFAYPDESGYHPNPIIINRAGRKFARSMGTQQCPKGVYEIIELPKP